MKKIINILTISTAIAIAGGLIYYTTYKNSSKPSIQTSSDRNSNPVAITSESCVPQKTIPVRNKNGSFTLGFSTLHKKSVNESLKIAGTVPPWLTGTLIYVGPGKFEMEHDCAHHWLDGLAMAHRFTINPDSIRYRNRLLESGYYTQAQETGFLRQPQEKKGKSFFSKISAVLSAPKDLYDNVNTNIVRYGNHLVALTETPTPLAFKHNTLATIDSLRFNDDLGGHFCCAHPHLDQEKKQWFNFFITYGKTSNYTFYTMPHNNLTRTPLASISTKRPAYIHSFAMTKNYLILVEPPFTVKPIDLLLSNKSFLENFAWKPENGTRFVVIAKENGTIVGEYITEAFFMLHHVNAFERNGQIIIDIPTYKNPAIISAYFFDNIHSTNPLPIPTATLERFNIQVDHDTITRSILTNRNIEMPRINSTHNGSGYRYVYGVHTEKNKTIANALIKIDIQKKTHDTWSVDGCYPSEPMFVQDPQATDEDSGVLLSVVLDVHEKKSFLLILDAHTMKELARAQVDHHIPFTMHGIFLPKI
jgi:beta,beta-carotene 9',10'-dioxygenase